MEKPLTSIQQLAKTSKEYIDNKLKYYKLVLVDELSSILTKIVINVIVFYILSLLFLFASLSVAFVIGEWYGKFWFGFLIIGIFFIIVLVLIYMAKNIIIRRSIENSIRASLNKNNIEIKKEDIEGY